MQRTDARALPHAVVDVVAAAFGALGTAIVLVQFAGTSSLVSLAAIASGLTLISVAVVSIARRRPLFSTAADRVTLVRAVLGAGCATIVVLALFGAVPYRSWWLAILAAPAVLLDAVDGPVARRTGTQSDHGSRLDMETDAALLLVLSVPAALALGWWILAIGAMRYVFVAAGRVRPALTGPLPFSQFRRVVAATQAVVLVIALLPVTPVAFAQVALAISLALLTVSFGRDAAYLQRRA